MSQCGCDSQCGCEPQLEPVKIAIITLSDTRALQNDRSGDRIVSLAEEKGHQIVRREIIQDERKPLESLLKEFVDSSGVQAVITTGGTGIAPRDQTVDVVAALLDVELPGFGEYFRALSIEEIGPKAILSRAIAGRIKTTLVFCLPGSTGAVTTGMSQCVLPILPHAVALASAGR